MVLNFQENKLLFIKWKFFEKYVVNTKKLTTSQGAILNWYPKNISYMIFYTLKLIINTKS